MTSMRRLRYYRLGIGIMGATGAALIATHPRAGVGELALAGVLVATGVAIILVTLWEFRVVARGGTA